MADTTKTDDQALDQPTNTTEVVDKPATTPPRGKGFWREFFFAVASHGIVYYVAPVVLAAAPAIWLYIVREPSVPQWSFLVFVVLTIVIVYLSIISLQFFFRTDFRLSRRKSLHLALFAIVVVTVTAPLALLLSYLSHNENRLMRLYNQVTPPLEDILRKGHIDNEDFNDLLESCIMSIHLSKPQYEVRATVVYLDESGRYLVVPKQGYRGPGFNKEMERLYFDLSPAPRMPCETGNEFENRLGVAGRSFLDKQPIRDSDVQIPKSGYRYKPHEGSSQDQPDRSIICFPIPDLRKGREDNIIGVLSISSPTAGVFTVNDETVARFYATLLGKFSTQLTTPPFINEVESRKNCGKPVESPATTTR